MELVWTFSIFTFCDRRMEVLLTRFFRSYLPEMRSFRVGVGFTSFLGSIWPWDFSIRLIWCWDGWWWPSPASLEVSSAFLVAWISACLWAEYCPSGCRPPRWLLNLNVAGSFPSLTDLRCFPPFSTYCPVSSDSVMHGSTTLDICCCLIDFTLPIGWPDIMCSAANPYAVGIPLLRSVDLAISCISLVRGVFWLCRFITICAYCCWSPEPCLMWGLTSLCSRMNFSLDY